VAAGGSLDSVPMGRSPDDGQPVEWGTGEQSLGARSEGRGRAPAHSMGLGAATWPFVDRDHKLQAAVELLSGAEAAAVVVSGPLGSGRTRLAQEAVASLRSRGRRAEWVTGTRGGRALPLGALAHLLPVLGAGSDPTAAWQALASALDGGAPGPRPVIGVDDAHLLDDASAALVHKVVLTRLADVVVTVLGGAPVPDLVDALRRDGLATRLELPAVTREHVDQLLPPALGGTVESRTLETLWRNSHGSAVLLRELVDAGRETARLRQEGGVWRWVGELALTDRLCEFVRGEIGELDDGGRAALELLALGGMLGLEDLVGMSSADVIAGLERRGLVVVKRAGRHPVARLAQPLHAQLLCAHMPQAVATSFANRLAGTESVQRWVREDPVRIGPLLLHLDGPPRDAAVLARAAAQANALSDHQSAERLARAALEEENQPRAWVALAEALRWQGRAEEADQACAAAAPHPMQPTVREGHTITTMLNLFYGLGRADEALAIAEEGEFALGTQERLVSTVARLVRLSSGEPLKAVDLLEESFLEHAAGSPAAVLEYVLRTTGLALLGYTDEALATAAQAWPEVRACSEDAEGAFARAALMLGEWMALELGGRIPAASARAADMHRETLDRAPSGCDALAALGRGSTSLAAGRLLEAVRWLDEAAIGLRVADPLGCLPLALAKQAQARAWLGNPDGAAEALALALGGSHSPVHVHDPELFLAEAWCAAVSAHDSVARRAAARAAESADALGHRAVEARALDACARLGLAGQVAGRLRVLAGEMSGPLFAAYAAHAEAAALQRADALEEVAAEFQELGALALAADTYGRAAEAHRHAGHRRRAAAAGARAGTLARVAGGLRTPVLDRLAPYALTAREREIARLAAEGTPNRSIARRLVLSVRTVETHLAHAYDKLGINSRAALESALAQEIGPP
jgi:DNA-binding CsgD family transcriptional regulator